MEGRLANRTSEWLAGLEVIWKIVFLFFLWGELPLRCSCVITVFFFHNAAEERKALFSQCWMKPWRESSSWHELSGKAAVIAAAYHPTLLVLLYVPDKVKNTSCVITASLTFATFCSYRQNQPPKRTRVTLVQCLFVKNLTGFYYFVWISLFSTKLCVHAGVPVCRLHPSKPPACWLYSKLWHHPEKCAPPRSSMFIIYNHCESKAEPQLYRSKWCHRVQSHLYVSVSDVSHIW